MHCSYSFQSWKLYFAGSVIKNTMIFPKFVWLISYQKAVLFEKFLKMEYPEEEISSSSQESSEEEIIDPIR